MINLGKRMLINTSIGVFSAINRYDTRTAKQETQ